MAGWQSDAPQFKGDINKALEQMNQDLTGQPPAEETYEERMYRQAYEADQAEARAAEQAAQAEAQRTERAQAVADKAARDAAEERKFDQANYVYGSDGKLYFMDPATGKTYRKSDYGNQFIPVKSIPAKSDKEAMAEAFARAKSRKMISPIPF